MSKIHLLGKNKFICGKRFNANTKLKWTVNKKDATCLVCLGENVKDSIVKIRGKRKWNHKKLK